MPSPLSGLAEGKYARIERERRFLLAAPPAALLAAPLPAARSGDERPANARTITDRYLSGARLRLRHVSGPDSDQYKLTQKIPAAHPGPVQGLITNMYLSKAEHDYLAATLPGQTLTKTRYSVPPLGIDVFDPPLHGLLIGEAEFSTDAEMLAFQVPGYTHAEITSDPRFTGGRLATASRAELLGWLAEYGISPDVTRATARFAREP